MYHRRVVFIGAVRSLLVVVAAGLLSGCGGHVSVGDPMPDAPVRNLDGQPSRLAVLRGRPVWLNFYETWCPPCQAEMPAIEREYAANAGRGLVVVGVDLFETSDDARAFADGRGLTFPVVVGGHKAYDAYGINGIPTSVFVDSSGVVRAVFTGEMRGDEMDQAIKAILNR
ncbi:MAG: TlpA family protein disulfide reductase [Candidatus Eremiobacteraeota bacterium]|nr:TlpA family protein disulfide reductase [Candidatus Eremiobacteraeota bacterium]